MPAGPSERWASWRRCPWWLIEDGAFGTGDSPSHAPQRFIASCPSRASSLWPCASRVFAARSATGLVDD
eukprot:1420357-Rhodomonas_salina.1